MDLHAAAAAAHNLAVVEDIRAVHKVVVHTEAGLEVVLARMEPVLVVLHMAAVGVGTQAELHMVVAVADNQAAHRAVGRKVADLEEARSLDSYLVAARSLAAEEDTAVREARNLAVEEDTAVHMGADLLEVLDVVGTTCSQGTAYEVLYLLD